MNCHRENPRPGGAGAIDIQLRRLGNVLAKSLEGRVFGTRDQLSSDARTSASNASSSNGFATNATAPAFSA